MAQSAAHFFIISLTWTRGRVTFMPRVSDASGDAARARDSASIRFEIPEARDSPLREPRVSLTLETMETAFLTPRIIEWTDNRTIGRQLDTPVLVATKTGVSNRRQPKPRAHRRERWTRARAVSVSLDGQNRAISAYRKARICPNRRGWCRSRLILAAVTDSAEFTRQLVI